LCYIIVMKFDSLSGCFHTPDVIGNNIEWGYIKIADVNV